MLEAPRAGSHGAASRNQNEPLLVLCGLKSLNTEDTEHLRGLCV